MSGKRVQYFLATLSTKFLTCIIALAEKRNESKRSSALILVRLCTGHLLCIRYGLDDRGSVAGGCKTFFCIPQLPDMLWGPSSLLDTGFKAPGS
jgi:hypothetical protein